MTWSATSRPGRAQLHRSDPQRTDVVVKTPRRGVTPQDKRWRRATIGATSTESILSEGHSCAATEETCNKNPATQLVGSVSRRLQVLHSAEIMRQYTRLLTITLATPNDARPTPLGHAVVLNTVLHAHLPAYCGPNAWNQRNQSMQFSLPLIHFVPHKACETQWTTPPEVQAGPSTVN